MRWYHEALKKYAVFGGRARRTEFWMYILFNFIFSMLAFCIDLAVGVATGFGFALLFFLYTVGSIIPSLTVTVRRLHDTGRTGWWMLIGAIPLLGAIILIVFYVQPGQSGPNQYGPDPKAVPAAAAA